MKKWLEALRDLAAVIRDWEIQTRSLRDAVSVNVTGRIHDLEARSKTFNEQMERHSALVYQQKKEIEALQNEIGALRVAFMKQSPKRQGRGRG